MYNIEQIYKLEDDNFLDFIKNNDPYKKLDLFTKFNRNSTKSSKNITYIFKDISLYIKTWHTEFDELIVDLKENDENAIYAIALIEGDSEWMEGHCLYSFPEYYTLIKIIRIDDDIYDDNIHHPQYEALDFYTGDNIIYDILKWGIINE